MSKVAPRNKEEQELLKKSGEIAAFALKKVLENVKVGVSLVKLDEIAEKEILQRGGQSSFKTVPGYLWTTCLTVNDEVVHGPPRDIKLSQGDVLGVDLGAVYQGWHSDVAWSVIVGEQVTGDREQEKKIFLAVGEKVLWQAISKAVEGNRIGDISSAIQQGIEGAGYNVVKSLAGHGIGKSAHEKPLIPEYGKSGTGLILKNGMSLAIEVIYTKGRGDMTLKSDGWTIASRDGSVGGLFEMSVIVGKNSAEVLTDWRKVE